MDAEWLDTVNDAVRNNEMVRARELLQGYVRYHRKDRQGWELLSRLTADPEERALCLSRLQELDRADAQSAPHVRSFLPSLLLRRDEPRPATEPAPRVRSFLPSLLLRRDESRPAAEPAPIRWLSLGLQASFFTVVLVLFLLVLVGVLPMFFGYRSLVILTDSMSPTIPQGSLIVAAPIPSKDLRIGDVVAFSPSPDIDLPIVHRITSIRTKNGVRLYTTRGDANRKSDPVEISLPPTAWMVVNHFPWLGYLISYASSTLGLIVLIAMPALLLAAIYAVDLARKLGRWLPPRVNLHT